MSRQFPIYAAFTDLSPNHHTHGWWRHPDGRSQVEYGDIARWRRIVAALERAHVDAVFIADGVGVSDVYGGSPDATYRHGMQFPLPDPASYVAYLAACTTDLGFVFTSNVLQSHPFEFARRISTLDEISGGRIGWNVVTSYQDSGARNFGLTDLPDHDERYRWAEEYLDVVAALWERSWDDGAKVADVENDVLFDPTRVHRIDHAGPRYTVAGPHLVEPSPQRTPVLFQAGASDAGRSFGARNAEAVFMPSTDPASAADDVADLRRRAVAHGRGADDVVGVVSLGVVLGRTESEARARKAVIRDSLSVEALLAFLSSTTGSDLSGVGADTTLAQVAGSNRIRGGVDAWVRRYGPDVRLRDIALASFDHRFVGTPAQLADHVEEWLDAGVGGFNIIPVSTMDSWDEFADVAAPVLVERGLMQPGYAAGTLREKLFGRDAQLPDTHPFRRTPGEAA